MAEEAVSSAALEQQQEKASKHRDQTLKYGHPGLAQYITDKEEWHFQNEQKKGGISLSSKEPIS